MKIFATIFLIIIILLFGLYAILYYSFNLSDPGHWINQKYRQQIIKYPLFRNLLRLHQVGDYRYGFVENNNKNLEIVIFQKDSHKLNPDTYTKVADQIYSLIKQPKQVIFTDKKLDEDINGTVDDQDLKNLTNSYSLNKNNVDYLKIFVLDEYTPIPTYAGIVNNANTIFLFTKPIAGITGGRNPSAVETSTILHEFGHLLGAGHIDKDNCIMSQKVENISGRPTAFTTIYCNEDLQEIRKSVLVN